MGDNQLSSMRREQKRSQERSQRNVGNESGQIKLKTELKDIAV